MPTIFCGANPHRSREIWQYVSMINTAAATYNWDNVANYDYTFRHLMEFNPGRSWANTYNQMWNLSMKDPISKNNGISYHKGGPGNGSGNNHARGVPNFSHNNNNGGSSGNSANHAKKKGRLAYCLYFSRGEKCKYGNKCRFIERCSYCDAADHHVLICPKLKKD